MSERYCHTLPAAQRVDPSSHIHSKEQHMHSTITGTGIRAISRHRRLSAATVAACVCAAAYVAAPAGAQQGEGEASQTKAVPGLKFDAPLKVCKVAGPGIPIGT